MRRAQLLVTALLVAACGREPAPPAQSPIPVGENQLAVPGGMIWYKVSGTAAGTPVVLLHGGPGLNSFYLKPFEDLANDRVVVRYDQLGGGKSGPMTDTSMMNIAHFVAELDSLRAALGVERWHVLGHSWGTILALEYYRAHAARVASLTLGSAVFDVPAFTRYASSLVSTLSDSAQRSIRRSEARHDYENPSYLNAINEFYGLYVFRNPAQPDLDSSFAAFNQAIYNYMQGPSEFTITGTLKDYNARDFLPQVAVPTLFTVGEFDEVDTSLVRQFAGTVPGAQLVQYAGAAHMTPWDAREPSVASVRAFLRAADSTAARP